MTTNAADRTKGADASKFAAKIIFEHFRRVSEWLGAPPHTISDFRLGDNWSLVIRTTAVTESALSAAIVAVLGKREIEEEIGKLPLGDRQFGKVKLAHKLGVLEADDRKPIEALGALRNKLAHGIKNLGFSFADMPANDAQEFFRQISHPFKPSAERLNRLPQETIDFFLLVRMSVIWVQCLAIASKAEKERDIMRAEVDAFRRWLSDLESDGQTDFDVVLEAFDDA